MATMNEMDRKRQQEVMALARRYEQELLKFARSRGFPSITIHDIYPTKKTTQQPNDTLVHQEIQQLRVMLEEKLSTLIELLATHTPEQVQPIINVHLDTGAISQAFLFGLNTMLDRQTDTLSKVIREVSQNQTVESVVSEPVSESASEKVIATVGTIGKVKKEYSQETIEQVKKYNHLKPAQIIELTGLSKTTVYDIVKELKEGGTTK